MKIVHFVTDCGQEESLISLSYCLSGTVSLKHIESVSGEGNREVGDFSVCLLGLQNVKNILKLRKSLCEIIIDRKERLL